VTLTSGTGDITLTSPNDVIVSATGDVAIGSAAGTTVTLKQGATSRVGWDVSGAVSIASAAGTALSLKQDADTRVGWNSAGAVSIAPASGQHATVTTGGVGDIVLTSADAVTLTSGTGDITLTSPNDVIVSATGDVAIGSAAGTTVTLKQGATSRVGWDVSGAVSIASAAGTALSLKQDADTRVGWNSAGAVSIASASGQGVTVSTGSTARVTVDSIGQVGIGQTNPTYKLDVNGDINFSGNLYKSGSLLGSSPWTESGSNVYRSSGNVGIGTTNPTYNLDVTGTGHFGYGLTVGGRVTASADLRVTTNINMMGSSSTLIFQDNVGDKIKFNDNGTFKIGTASSPNNYMEYTSLFGHKFYIGGTPFITMTGDGRLGIGVQPEKNLDVSGEGRVSGAFHVGGALSKASGSFMIDHPLPEMKETHNLYHSFIEGPRADLIYRGTVRLLNGRATINIDTTSSMTSGTFEALNRDVQSFTSNESDWDPVRSSVVGNVLMIECQNPTSTALISWMVIGERNDQHMYDTDWTDENGRVVPEQLKKSATT